MPNMHENTKLIRVPKDFAEQLKKRAEAESRTMSAQLQLEVKFGIAAREAQSKGPDQLPHRPRAR